MLGKTIAAALMYANGYWHGPEPVRMYTLENHDMQAETVANPAIYRFHKLAWPGFNKEQKIMIPGDWKPGTQLPKFRIPKVVTRKYGDVTLYYPGEEEEIIPPEPREVVRSKHDWSKWYTQVFETKP